jgi:hypothetical protein
MNEIWEKIKEVIRQDAAIQFVYSEEGKECVIGGLAKAANIPFPAANTCGIGVTGWSDDLSRQDYEEMVRFRTALLSAYPVLTIRDLERLQRQNDYFSSTKVRREALLTLVKDMQKDMQGEIGRTASTPVEGPKPSQNPF